MNITKLTHHQRIHTIIKRIPELQQKLEAGTKLQLAVVADTYERCEEMLASVGLSIMPETRELGDGPNYYTGTEVEFFIAVDLRSIEIRGRTRMMVLVDAKVNVTQNLQRHNISPELAAHWMEFTTSLQSFSRASHILERDLFIPIGA